MTDQTTQSLETIDRLESEVRGYCRSDRRPPGAPR